MAPLAPVTKIRIMSSLGSSVWMSWRPARRANGARHMDHISRVYYYDPTGRRNVTMDEQQWLAGRFEEHRPRLRAVAYRMLGSLGEADDAVQEAWVRLSRAETSEVENLGAWLTTVVARVALNMLRSRAARREAPLDGRLPDPIIDPAG